MFQSNRRGTFLVECSRFQAPIFVGKFGGKVLVRFDLRKGLSGNKIFLVVTKLCQMKCLLDRSLNLVHFE